MNSRASIEVDSLRKSFGTAEVLRGVRLAVQPGSVLAILGPSGCGKTTLLRTIAGLERPDAGSIRLDGVQVAGPATHVPPERRRIGMVFQDWALFPHLTVAQNVAYGLTRAERRLVGRSGRARRTGRAGRAGARGTSRVDEVLDMVGLGGLGPRHPGTLSGGQQQRVALARALAPRPAVLLLDEPFSNLDAALRAHVRAEVARLLDDLGVTAVFVTHDQDEALLLGDEVAVMRDGLVAQQAAPSDLYARPATPWVASFVGDANLVPGVASGDSAATALGPIPLDNPAHGEVSVLVRPEDLALDTPSDDGVSVTVERREYYGHDTVYAVRVLEGPAARVRAAAAPRFRPGDAAGLRYTGPPTVAFAAPPNGTPSPVASGIAAPPDDASPSTAHAGSTPPPAPTATSSAGPEDAAPATGTVPGHGADAADPVGGARGDGGAEPGGPAVTASPA